MYVLLIVTKAKKTTHNILITFLVLYYNRSNLSAAKNKFLIPTSQIEGWGTNDIFVKSKILHNIFSVKEIRTQMLEFLST